MAFLNYIRLGGTPAYEECKACPSSASSIIHPPSPLMAVNISCILCKVQFWATAYLNKPQITQIWVSLVSKLLNVLGIYWKVIDF